VSETVLTYPELPSPFTVDKIGGPGFKIFERIFNVVKIFPVVLTRLLVKTTEL
jgi:hypothetical protein